MTVQMVYAHYQLGSGGCLASDACPSNPVYCACDSFGQATARGDSGTAERVVKRAVHAKRATSAGTEEGYIARTWYGLA